MSDKVYEEIGANYRFFLAWRHATFGGGLAVLWGTCSLLAMAYERAFPFAWLVPLLAALALFSLWLADRRTRQIYRALIAAGKVMEKDGKGPYSALAGVGIPEDAPWFPRKGRPICKLFSQSLTLDCFFLGAALVLLLATAVVAYGPPLKPAGYETVPCRAPEGTAHGVAAPHR
jgi:hypothetical protein